MDNSFLRSKVARRIFALFMVCALLPLSALAYFSYSRVTSELESQAGRVLHQASKSAGMAVIQRLTFLETDLSTVAGRLSDGATLPSATRGFRKRIENRFRGLAVASGDGRTLESIGALTGLPALSPPEGSHLQRGKTLVTTLQAGKGPASVFIARALDPGKPERGVLFGEVHPRYLWGGEEFLSLSNELFVLDGSGRMLFSSIPASRLPLGELNDAMAASAVAGQFEWRHEGEAYRSGYWAVFMRPTYHAEWVLVHSQARADILEPLRTFEKIFLLVVALSFLVVLLLSLNQIRRNLVPIELLKEATGRIAARDFGTQVEIESGDEFQELGESFNQMASGLEYHLKVLTAINRIGIALSAESDTHLLMETIVNGAKSVSNADAGALFTVTGDGRLRLSVMSVDSLKDEALAGRGETIALYDEEGRPNTGIVAAYSVLEDAVVNIPDIYASEGFDFSGNREFDRETGYRSRSFLTVPMKNHDQDIIGVLQLINARDRRTGETVPFSAEDRRLAETMASQAAVALTKNQLIEDFKRLFDSMTELIAKAIDEKSPYTGGHCRRVPELTMMLAEAVSRTKEGAFGDFTLTEAELYELRVAALLHDCGKVTTPVHIVDKSTKLEAIFDRMRLVDTRFEVLRRDAEIAFLRETLASLNGGLPEQKEKKPLLGRMEEDRDFVRACNRDACEGGGDDFQERLEEIARRYRWVNAEGNEESVISDDELYHLSVSEGTLTPEERRVVNSHVATTIKMLEGLPYPKSLSNVPRFAAAHHERMDGRGYPNGLAGESIPVQARIIAVADIFEALTATDRPYRKANTLGEALRLMHAAAREGHIDPDLLDVFIKEKVYLRYAERYLSPEQLEEADPAGKP